MTLGRGIGRHEKSRFRHNDQTLCYGCDREFWPDDRYRAWEVLCGTRYESANPATVSNATMGHSGCGPDLLVPRSMTGSGVWEAA